MDFFGQQERARSASKRLLFLFTLSVVLTNAAVCFAVAFALRFTHLLAQLSYRSGARQGWLVRMANHFSADGIWNWELFGWVTLLVLCVIAAGSSLKLWQLSAGGAKVQELLGGRLLNLNTPDPDERRLLNVVEEMAIASGVPVPDVYLLEEENGINALAAGNDASDASVGVTFGAVKLLNRDELQGVVAHEFSHILNGDMRLNTRLIGWLHGILGLVVLGRVLTLSFLDRRDRDAGWGVDTGSRSGPFFHPAFIPAFVLGAICIVAGSFGAFFARIFKSAVSRQREYLADAAAVQFPRNPDGLAGALKKIGGLRWRSVLNTPRAEEASHMYFNDGMRRRWFGFTSTHPPLTQRIKRIDPRFDGRYPAISMERVLRESKAAEVYREYGEGKPVDFEKVASVLGPSGAPQELLYATAARQPQVQQADSPCGSVRIPLRAVAVVGAVPPLARLSPEHLRIAEAFLRGIPDDLRQVTRELLGATALVYAMLCSKDLATRAAQISALETSTEPGIVPELNRLLPLVDVLEPGAFLPIADLCVRALRQLSPEQYANFRCNLQQLIEADDQIDLFEYMLQRMIIRHLDPLFRNVSRTPVQYYTLRPLLPACAVLLSGLARIGHDNEDDALAAFGAGALELGADAAALCLLDLEQCNLPQMDEAITKTAQAARPLKQQILNALICAAATDGLLKRREAELLRAIADAFAAPLPPFLSAEPERAQEIRAVE